MTGALETADLQAFAATVRAGSITRAAAALGVTQPTVSQRIQRLEHSLGARLLERRARGTRLTADGEALLAYAERILALLDEAHSTFRDRTAPAATGRRTVALLEDLAVATLPGVLADFAALHPDVDLEVIIDSAAALAKRSETLDMTVGDPSVIDAAFVRWRMPIPLAWTCAASFDVMREPLPLVMFSLPCEWRQDVLDALARHGRTWRISFQSTNLSAVQAAIGAGLGLGALFPVNLPVGCLHPASSAALPAAPNVEVMIARKAGSEGDAALDSLERLLRRTIAENPLLTAISG